MSLLRASAWRVDQEADYGGLVEEQKTADEVTEAGQVRSFRIRVCVDFTALPFQRWELKMRDYWGMMKALRVNPQWSAVRSRHP